MNPYRIGAHVKRRKCDGLAYPEQSGVRIVSPPDRRRASAM